MPITLICLDADDTLWHNETVFQATYGRFRDLLAPFADSAVLQQRLADTEHRNLAIYGYGVKGFILSTIETALDVAGPRLPIEAVREIVSMGREMMQHPIDLIDGVADSLVALRDRGRLVLVTKGDLFHQEAKLASSGLGDLFSGIEIVSNKTSRDYARIFARYDAQPAQCLMAGNSIRSDILPALEAGAYAALIPYPLVWEHEAAAPLGEARYRELHTVAELAGWIDEIA